MLICTFSSIAWWIITAKLGIAEDRVWNGFFLQFLWEFALGMVVSELLSKKDIIRIDNILLVIAAIVGIGIEGIMGLKGGLLKIFNDVFALTGFLSLGLLLYQIGLPRKIGSKVEPISYELYLIHYLIFSTLFGTIQGRTLLQQCLLSFVALIMCYLISLLFNSLNQTIYKFKLPISKMG